MIFVTERVVVAETKDTCGAVFTIVDNGRGGHSLGVPIALEVLSKEDGDIIYVSLTPEAAKELGQALIDAGAEAEGQDVN